MTHNKINIFFDTNVLERRKDGNLTCVSKIIMSHDFYDILKFAKLDNRISLYIPEIVWGEIKAHLLSCYTSQKQSLNSHIEKYEKIFGDLLDVSCNFNAVDYPEYLETISKEFWDANKEYCELVEYDKSDKLLKVLVEKVFGKNKPFTEVKGKSKTYSDAGFKDAIIIETMLSFCKDDEMNILYTNDRDFDEVFKQYENENYREIKDLEILKSLIEDFIKPDNTIRIKKLFEENEYIKTTIFHQIGITDINEVNEYSVMSVEQNEEKDNFIVEIIATVNEAEYDIEIEFDDFVNEIISIGYKIKND